MDFRKVSYGEEAIYCAALYDGHGLTATVADLAKDQMLALVEAELQQISSEKLTEKLKTDVRMCVCVCVCVCSIVLMHVRATCLCGGGRGQAYVCVCHAGYHRQYLNACAVVRP